MDNILEIKDLRKSYKDFTLDDLTFNVERGSVMGFIGPNGSGKSTTIKLIMNLIKKNSGNINIFGMDNLKHDKEIKQHIGFVYDENYFYEELNIMEMKCILSPFYKSWDDIKGSKELLDNDTRREFVSIKETNFGFEALTKDISKARIIFKGKGMIEKASLEEIMVYTVRGNV